MMFPKRFAAATIFVAMTQLVGAWALDQRPQVPPEASPMIRAWVIDIPSAAKVSNVEGVIVIMNKEEKKYELLRPGRQIDDDDIIRMMPEAVLHVTYGDGSGGSFDYGDYPEDPSGQGKWLIYKIQGANPPDNGQ